MIKNKDLRCQKIETFKQRKNQKGFFNLKLSLKNRLCRKCRYPSDSEIFYRALKNGKFKYNNVLQCNKLDKIIISDASTLILLEKIALLDKLAGNFEFIIPQEVYNEAVAKGKEAKSEDAYSIENKINGGVIKVMKIKDRKKANQIIGEFNLEKGETESIVLFLQEKADILAIDDHKAINVCKIYKIPFITALTFVITVLDAKIIMKSEAREMVRNLGIYGRYKDELIYKALNYIGAEKL